MISALRKWFYRVKVISWDKKKIYLFLFLDVIQGKCSKYWLNFYFKPEKHTKNSSEIWILSQGLQWIWTRRHKCQLLYSKCYSLQRQTLDHDPLTTVVLGHFNSRASLYCLILPHTHTQQSHVQHRHTSITFTQMSWERSSRESDSVYTDIKTQEWSRKRRTQRKEEQTVL